MTSAEFRLVSSQVKEEELAQKEEEAEEERARKKAAKRREVPTYFQKRPVSQTNGGNLRSIKSIA